MYRYGCRPDPPDHRDIMAAAPPVGIALPPLVELRPLCPPIYDQRQSSSCTGNAVAAVVDFERRSQGLPFINPSRLFVYWNARAREGTVDQDNGATIRDAIKGVVKIGICAEDTWPFDLDTITIRPDDIAFAEAIGHRASVYQRLHQSPVALKSTLASGHPVAFGISIYESFESREVANTGIIPLPGADESLLGGHAIVAVGYNDTTGFFTCRNSWGLDWGLAGYFLLPYTYALDPTYARDFWRIAQEH